MKHIKLFENYFEDEEWNRLLPYFTMSQSERDKLFFDEVKKAEPNLQVIEDLLDTQLVDPNVRDVYQQTPLDWAAIKNKWTPLHHAAWNNSRAVAELLLDRGADYDARDEWQRTPLHWAAAHNSQAVAELLLDRGAEIDARDQYQQTPLYVAAREGSQAVAELLRSRGATE